jgi:hypothetical protein
MAVSYAGAFANGPFSCSLLSVNSPLVSGDLVTIYNSSAAAILGITGDGRTSSLQTRRYSTDATSGVNSFIKARGTAASPVAVASADVVGIVAFNAFDGTNNIQIGAITCIVTTYTGAANISSQLRFFTRADGAASNAENLRIDKDGLILVNSTTKVLDQNGGFYGVQASAYSRQVPATGFNITVANSVSYLILDPAGTLATGTVKMPVTPIDGHEVTVSSSQIVTSLTVSANTGQTMDGTITTFAANGFAKWKYALAVTTWYRVG